VDDFDFSEFLRLHQETIHAIDMKRSDIPQRIAAVCATRDGARYASFYESRLRGMPPDLAAPKQPGGS
jgi:hypothetical protein